MILKNIAEPNHNDAQQNLRSPTPMTKAILTTSKEASAILKLIQKHGQITVRHVARGIAAFTRAGGTESILFCISILPYIGFLTGLAGMIVLLCFYKSAKDGAIAMLEQGK